MSVLSNVDIRECLEFGSLRVYGLNKDTIRENGLDLTISEIYARENPDYDNSYVDIHDQDPNRFRKETCNSGNIIIRPHEFVLFSTNEIIEIPSDIVGFCAIRSTIARSGLFAPSTIVDAGFCGALTIEVFNASNRNIILHPGDRFLHVILSYTKTPCDAPYSGLYQNQKIITLPKKSIL